MSIDVIKQVPTLLENPVVVIDSKSDDNSKIVMGELYDDNGKIVTAVLKLKPSSRSGNQLDLIKISSTQGRGHIESLFKYENGKNVAVRYVDKKRIHSWLNVNRLQLPLHSFNLDSNNSISDPFENVKNSLSVNLDKSAELSKLEAEKKKYDDEIFLLRRDFEKLKKTDAPLAMARKNSQRSEDTSVKENITQSNGNVKKNSIETDSKGRMLTREQSEALSDIRKQFFEVLDGAGVNYREGGAVESETKLSKSSNKRLTNGKGKGYNNNNRIKLSERECAMVSSAVMAYNTRFGKENELKPIIGVNANNNYYVCANEELGKFSVLARYDSENEVETIKRIREVLRNEVNSISEFSALYAESDVTEWGNNRRRNNLRVSGTENRRESEGNGGLYAEKS